MPFYNPTSHEQGKGVLVLFSMICHFMIFVAVVLGKITILFTTAIPISESDQYKSLSQMKLKCQSV